MEVSAEETGHGAAVGFGAPASRTSRAASRLLDRRGRASAARPCRLRGASRAEVDAFYRAAIAAGAKDNGPPGLRPHYHANYYGAFVLDLDGNNIEAVCHATSSSEALRPVMTARSIATPAQFGSEKVQVGLGAGLLLGLSSFFVA